MRALTRRRFWILCALAALAVGASGCRPAPTEGGPAPAARPAVQAPRVAAIGRLAPKDGLRRLAGPSYSTNVVARLDVEEGDAVAEGQVIAVLESQAVAESNRARSRADALAREAALVSRQVELRATLSEERRHGDLHAQGVVSDAQAEVWTRRVESSQAAVRQAERELAAAQAAERGAQLECERAVVRSPVTGHVIAIHARPGEKVQDAGIAEVGITDPMYVVAEVYETDVRHVRVGQRATAASPALPRELSGTVERIGHKIGRKDAVGSDPAAKMDARVTPVFVRLDAGADVARFTDLEVSVRFEP